MWHGIGISSGGSQVEKAAPCVSRKWRDTRTLSPTSLGPAILKLSRLWVKMNKPFVQCSCVLMNTMLRQSRYACLCSNVQVRSIFDSMLRAEEEEGGTLRVEDEVSMVKVRKGTREQLGKDLTSPHNSAILTPVSFQASRLCWH